jgi:maleate isomerase
LAGSVKDAAMRREPAITLHAKRPRLDERAIDKRVGMIILATDHTTEADYQRMVAGPHIGLYVNRIAYANPTTPDNLRKMLPALAECAQLILPDEPLDAVVYSCTSASVVIGDAEIGNAIGRAKPGALVVTPSKAAAHALNALRAQKISILTPYTIETSQPMAAYFQKLGFEIASFACLGFEDDREMARIAPSALVEIAREVTAPEADALFISCTALRAAIVAAVIEAEIGRPVVTSNQATAWVCLRHCGDEAARPEFGRLMTIPSLPDSAA